MGALEFKFAQAAPLVSSRIAVELERGPCNVLWATMARAAEGESQNFSLPLLHAMSELLGVVRDNGASWPNDGTLAPVHYMVLRSGNPDYFSLGGDLNHFRSCIERRDREALFQYSRLCLDILYAWGTVLNNHATTIALVQGRALGGGFEAALSADYLIAEEHSEFGFPEILFGLFPCTGGMSLLARRVGVYEAERMMIDGRIYTAAELKAKGVVDEVCPRGDGNLAVNRFIAGHDKHRHARLTLQRARHRMVPLEYRELLVVVEEWVEAAMNLPERDLNAMDMLIRLQRNTQSPANR